MADHRGTDTRAAGVHRFPAHTVALLTGGVVALLLAILAGLIMIYQSTSPAPVVTPESTAYAPEKARYKPGDTLTFTSTVTIAEAGVPTVTRGWRFRHAGLWRQARYCDGVPIPATRRDDLPAYPAEAVGARVTTVLTDTVPHMPPGEYVYTTSIRNSGGEVVYSVAVRIDQAC